MKKDGEVVNMKSMKQMLQDEKEKNKLYCN